MTQVIALFSNQTDAEQVLNALTTAGVPTSDVQMMVVTPGTAVADSFNLAEPESRHLQQKVQNGGVLIIVNFSNKTDSNRTADILEQQNSTLVAQSSA